MKNEFAIVDFLRDFYVLYYHYNFDTIYKLLEPSISSRAWAFFQERSYCTNYFCRFLSCKIYRPITFFDIIVAIIEHPTRFAISYTSLPIFFIISKNLLSSLFSANFFNCVNSPIRISFSSLASLVRK